MNMKKMCFFSSHIIFDCCFVLFLCLNCVFFTHKYRVEKFFSWTLWDKDFSEEEGELS